MKKMITLLFLVFTLGANITFGQADDIATVSKIVRSQSEMRNYALGLVKSGSRGVSGNFAWYSGEITYTNVTGAYAEEVLATLFTTEFVYKPISTNDNVDGWVWLYDENGWLIFYGSASYKPTEQAKYNIWMQSIPLPISDVESAEIWVLDENGKTVKKLPTNINWMGQLTFDPYLAGAVNGLLVVRKTGGEVLTFSTSDGAYGQVGEVLEQNTTYGISGHKILETVPGTTNVVHVIALWDEPTVFLDVKSEPTVPVLIDVTGIYYDERGQVSLERPSALVYKAIDSDQEYVVELDTESASIVEMPSGKSRIYFQWKHFGQKPMLYTGPYDGGKG